MPSKTIPPNIARSLLSLFRIVPNLFAPIIFCASCYLYFLSDSELGAPATRVIIYFGIGRYNRVFIYQDKLRGVMAAAFG